MSSSDLFDIGLQPERTQLAWRRTALAIATASLIAARLCPALLGHVLWAIPGLLGVAFAVFVWMAARRRYRRYRRFAVATPADDPVSLPGAEQMLAVTVFGVVSGGVSLIIVFAVSSR